MSDVSNGYLVLAEGLCDPTNEVTFELTVTYTLDSISVGVAGGDAVSLSPQPPLVEIGQLVMTIGNVPGTTLLSVFMTFYNIIIPSYPPSPSPFPSHPLFPTLLSFLSQPSV